MSRSAQAHASTLSRRLRRIVHRLRHDGVRHLVKVASHPRSGTHLAEAFIAKNFYPERDLAVRPVQWGHWSSRQVDQAGNPYGRLFGGHGFGDPVPLGRAPAVYIYRDGRAVARSIWRSPHFLSAETKARVTFDEFVRSPLDWHAAPEIRATDPVTIAVHWHRHVTSWLEMAQTNQRILVVRFEQLVLEPEVVHRQLHERFFSSQELRPLVRIDERVGIVPNDGQIDSWRQAFSTETNAAFCDQLPDTSLLWT